MRVIGCTRLTSDIGHTREHGTSSNHALSSCQPTHTLPHVPASTFPCVASTARITRPCRALAHGSGAVKLTRSCTGRVERARPLRRQLAISRPRYRSAGAGSGTCTAARQTLPRCAATPVRVMGRWGRVKLVRLGKARGCTAGVPCTCQAAPRRLQGAGLACAAAARGGMNEE